MSYILIFVKSKIDATKHNGVLPAYTDPGFMAYLFGIGAMVAVLHGIIGTLIPLAICMMLTRFFGKNKSFKEGLEVLPFAVFAGLCFTIPYTIVGVFLGPDFPSLIGSLIALPIVITAARKGFLMPRKTWDFPPEAAWGKDWMGSLKPKVEAERPHITLFSAWVPYLIVALLLVLSRTWVALKGFLTAPSVTITAENILGTGIKTSAQLLYSPGTIFIIAVICAFFIQRMKWQEMTTAVSVSLKTMIGASVALGFAVPMVRILIQSTVNAAGYDSIPLVLAQGVASIAGGAWPAFAAVIGSLGTF